MTVDTNIPLWGLITVCGVLSVKLLQRYCVELAEGLLKWVSMLATVGLPRDAKVLWHRELLFHELEEIARDLVIGRARGEVALRAIWSAADLLLGVPSLRAAYARRAAAGERADDSRAATSRRLDWSRLVTVAGNYRHLRVRSPLIMLLAFLALALVLVPGFGSTDQGGATRGFALPSIVSLRPSDFAKLAVVIYLPAWLSGRTERAKELWTGFVPVVTLLGLACGLLLLEPDLGSAVILGTTGMALFFVAGASLGQLSAFACVGAVTTFLMMATQTYRVDVFHWEPNFPVIFGFVCFFAVVEAVTAIPLILFRLKFQRRLAQEAFGSLMATGIAIWVYFEVLLNVAWWFHLVPNDAVSPELSITRATNIACLGVGVLIAACVVIGQASKADRNTA